MYFLAEQAILPDRFLRFGIRSLLAGRIRKESAVDLEEFKGSCRESEIALCTADANSQHYEVKTEFFKLMLGPRLKYSSCFWESDEVSLQEAEEKSLSITVQRAGIYDGAQVLELGCGWGSLSLYMAEHFPNCKITAVSNSKTQKEHIDSFGFENLEVVTENIAKLSLAPESFDRVVSVEAFEHMRNYEQLFSNISSWMKSDGLLFFHVFNHKDKPYFFETGWMAENFFSGGTMLSENVIPDLVHGFEEVNRWKWNGCHYARTLRSWLDNLDSRKSDAASLFKVRSDLQKWRIFLMACEELFQYRGGEEWYVTHWLFKKQ